MGVPACLTLHARDRDGPDRRDDHRKAASIHRRRRIGLAAGLIWLAGIAPADTLRIATFHTELARDGPGLLLRDIMRDDPQVMAVREVLRAADADIVFLAGVDWDHDGHALAALVDGLNYPHRFANRPNRGVQIGIDRDGDGRLGEPEDAAGYGAFTGYEGAALISRWPLRLVEDLTNVPWQGGLHDAAFGDMPLSSTVHWDLAAATPGGEIRLWAWHATAPVFDGPEDRNGRRNHDEAKIWVDRLDRTDAPVVVLGVANADPMDGDGRPDAIAALLERLGDPRPTSDEGRRTADPDHRGDPSLDTALWPDGPGHLRVDYVLPNRSFAVRDAGVLWPPNDGSALAEAVRTASRHRLVWVDVTLR